MNTSKLVIVSLDNPDWNGVYLKKDIEQEMKDLDNTPTSDTDWICWVLGHMFDCKDFTGEIEKFVCDCDTLVRVTFKFADGAVSITKA